MRYQGGLAILQAFHFGILPSSPCSFVSTAVRQQSRFSHSALEMAPRFVYAVRHGESVWNVLRKKHPSEEDRYSSVLYHPDCDITDLGVQQSKDAGIKMQQLLDTSDEDQSIEVMLVVSPLRRALQTADGMVAGGLRPPASIIVQPFASEIVIDSCDIGSPTSDLQLEFPAYDFSRMQEYWWWPYGLPPKETYESLSKNGEREPESSILDRIDKLRGFVNDLEAPVVILVCHSETIWWLSSYVKDGERCGTWTENGEIVDVTTFVRNS